MKRFKDKILRKRNWNYKSPASYFVTISTSGKSKYLGALRDPCVHLNQVGLTAFENWKKIPEHFPFVTLGEFVVMPDHVHGIVIIGEQGPGYVEGGGALSCSPTTPTFRPPIALEGKNKFGPQSGNLGSIIKGYKSSVKSFATRNNLMLTWQSRYNDKIIWDKGAFDNISRYIIKKHPQPSHLKDSL